MRLICPNVISIEECGRLDVIFSFRASLLAATVLSLVLLADQQLPAQATFLFNIEGGQCDTGGNCGFNFSHGVAVDAASSIYVTNWRGEFDGVEVFDGNGNFLRSFGSQGAALGQLDGPLGILVDDLNHVWVADRRNHRIQVFDNAGAFQFAFGSEGTGPGQFMEPSSVALGPDGDVIITDTFNNRIQVFDESGNFQFSFGSEGGGLGQFQTPRFSTVDAMGNIYVADTDNHRVQVFDSGGGYLFEFGSQGMGEGQFDRPYGIQFDNHGSLYVADSNNQRVQVFDPDGAFQYAFGTLGTGLGEFTDPVVIAWADGLLYVADEENNRVSVFSVGPEASSCDFNGDDVCDSGDLNILYKDIADRLVGDWPTDLDGSGVVDNADINTWLQLAGDVNDKVYLPGDTDLDGDVDGPDFTTLATFFGNVGSDPDTAMAYWRHGNFTGRNTDGSFDVGGPDFTSLATYFGHVSVLSVPEPGYGWLLIGAICLFVRRVVIKRRWIRANPGFP